MLPYSPETVSVKRVWTLLFFFVYIVNFFFINQKEKHILCTTWSMYHSLKEMSSQISTHNFSLYVLNSVVFLCMNKLFNQPFIDG